MGSLFGAKKRRTPDADTIRKQEEEKIRAENLRSVQEQEAKRSKLRGRLISNEEDEEIGRKRLFGE